MSWEPIATAPTDGTVVRVRAELVETERWHPAFRGLPPIELDAAYHPDAGWCVDDIREITKWWRE